ncbi:MAG: protein translocase subunit SecF [Candidatus Brennerbacteria bacterium]|nr:protein translocase subunit SecF [Candidatus Brennerbacteria bacterium]
MNLIKYKNIFLGFSGALVAVSAAALLAFGLVPGADLTGGTRWQVKFAQNVSASAVVEILKAAGADSSAQAGAAATINEEGVVTIRLGPIDEPLHAAYQTALGALGEVSELNFSSIGSTVGAELRRKAVYAVLFVLLGISLYIAWAFRKVSAPVKSWKYGAVTLATLFHDVAIPTGLLAALGAWKGIEIDTNFIVALLVVMGFSVHDTIVVFDRIRENLLNLRAGRRVDSGGAGKQSGADFAEVINASVRETFTRSVNTSLTLVVVLFALIIAGPSSLFYFTLVILVGTVVGTYSSIFVASPLLYLLGRRARGA